jgi:hypothetical protein
MDSLEATSRGALARPGARGGASTFVSIAVICIGSLMVGSWVGHDLLHVVRGWTSSDLRLYSLGAVVALALPFALAGMVRMWPGDSRVRFHPVADRVAIALLLLLWPMWDADADVAAHPPTEFPRAFVNLTERLAIAEIVMVTFGFLALALLLNPTLSARSGWSLYGSFALSLVGAAGLTHLYVAFGL